VLGVADASAQGEPAPRRPTAPLVEEGLLPAPEGPPPPPPPPPEDGPIAPAPTAAAPTAAIPDVPPVVIRRANFGDAGVSVITADSSLGITSTEYSQSEARRFSASFSPGFDYFVIRRLSVGLDLTIAYGLGRGYGADGSLVETMITAIGGGPRFGLDVPLGEVVSFYSRATLGVESVHRESRLVSGRSLSTAGAPSARRRRRSRGRTSACSLRC
jgi:hypothetical protein